MKPRLLLIDDDKKVLHIFRAVLGEYNATFASNGAQAIKLLEKGERFDVIVSDVKMPQINGIELLEFIKNQSYHSEVILVTAHATVESAVKAMKMGAFDYLIKPLYSEETVAVVERAVATVKRKNQSNSKLNPVSNVGTLAGESAAMLEVYRQLDQAALASDRNLLIIGETGTGKELAARSVHEKSERRASVFSTLNCGLLSADSWKSELFGELAGHRSSDLSDREGYFLQTRRGTLLLDEVSLLPMEAQSALLGVLDSRTGTPAGSDRSYRIDCRIMATTNRDLPNLVKDGAFREDLYYRLSALTISLPPLRDRLEDIDSLAYTFLDRSGMRSKIQRISDDAIARLKRYNWPGNVRELRNCIESSVSFSEGPELAACELELPATPAADENGIEIEDTFDKGDLTYRQALEIGRDQAARKYLSQLIKVTFGNVSHASRIAGVARPSLHRLLKRYCIDPSKERLSGNI